MALDALTGIEQSTHTVAWACKWYMDFHACLNIFADDVSRNYREIKSGNDCNIWQLQEKSGMQSLH